MALQQCTFADLPNTTQGHHGDDKTCRNLDSGVRFTMINEVHSLSLNKLQGQFSI